MRFFCFFTPAVEYVVDVNGVVVNCCVLYVGYGVVVYVTYGVVVYIVYGVVVYAVVKPARCVGFDGYGVVRVGCMMLFSLLFLAAVFLLKPILLQMKRILLQMETGQSVKHTGNEKLKHTSKSVGLKPILLQ